MLSAGLDFHKRCSQVEVWTRVPEACGGPAKTPTLESQDALILNPDQVGTVGSDLVGASEIGCTCCRFGCLARPSR
jgi:hypothetical protein